MRKRGSSKEPEEAEGESLGKGSRGLHRAWTRDRWNRLSVHRAHFEKQTASKKGRCRDQRHRSRERDALRGESGLSAGVLLRESAVELCDRDHEAAGEYTLFPRPNRKRAGGANYAKMGAKVGASTRPHKGFAQRRDGPLRGRSASKGPLTAFQNGIG